ncbi:retrovirus-related Pol polyprotein from transposon opus [Trichonephila clavipes]|nr:retrovirus-related Pol polyprotein from transposon opus [Trichonephila clavipes]
MKHFPYQSRKKLRLLNHRRGNCKAKITKLETFLNDKAPNARRLLIQSKLDNISEIFSCMETLKIEYYEVLEEEKLPSLELTFDQMEEELESIKVGLQTLLLKHDDISKNVSICNTALSNTDNSKFSFVKLPDLGDEKPSHLLRKMKELSNGQLQDDFLQSLWLQRMPPHIQTVLSASSEPLDKLAIIADKVSEVVGASSTICAATTVPPPSQSSSCSVQPTMDSLARQIQELSLQVAELTRERNSSRHQRYSSDRRRSHSRSRSVNRGSGICYYHRRYKEQAHKCVSPCAFVQKKRVSSVIAGMAEPSQHTSRLFLLDRKSGQKFLIDSGSEICVIPPSPTMNKSPQSNFSLFSANNTKIPAYDLSNPSLISKSASHGTVHHIITTGPPVIARPKRLHPKLYDAVKVEFEFLLAQGIIRPSKSPWSSSLHVVPKSDSTVRPVGDYRQLNSVTEFDSYPMPYLNDFFIHALHGKKMFSKIDIFKAFHQIPIAERFLPKAAEQQYLLSEFLKGSKSKKDSKPLNWSSEAITAFQRCKQALADAALLAHPSPSAPLALHVDFSDYAIGGALHQVVDSELQPLAFFFQKTYFI